MVRTSLREPALSACSQAGLVNNLNDGLAWGLLPLLFVRGGLPVGQVGLLAALYPAVWGLGQLITGPLSDRLGRKPLITAGMLVQAVALAGIALAGSFLPWAAGAVLLGVGTAMVYPTLLAAISDVAHPSWRATAVGVYRLWRDTGFAVAPCSPGWSPTSPAWRRRSGSSPPSPPPPAWSWPCACTRPTGRSAQHDRPPWGAPLRFATFLAPNMLPVYRFLADRIGDRLGRPVELVVGRSFDQFEQGEADLGVICGLPYVWLADRRPPPVEPLAAPVLAGARYAGRPVYYSDVIVAATARSPAWRSCEGRSWAYNEPASHSGHTVTLYSLVRMGARPGSSARVVEAGFHQRAIRLVHSGAVDAAAIDSQVLAIELRDHPGWPRPAGDRRLRSVHHPAGGGRQPPPRPAQGPGPGVAGRPGRRPGRAADARLMGSSSGFTPVDDAAYDDIRAMLATIEAAGWTSLTQTAVDR